MDWCGILVRLLAMVIGVISGYSLVGGLSVGPERLKTFLCLLWLNTVQKYFFKCQSTGASVLMSAKVRGRPPPMGRC